MAKIAIGNVLFLAAWSTPWGGPPDLATPQLGPGSIGCGAVLNVAVLPCRIGFSAFLGSWVEIQPSLYHTMIIHSHIYLSLNPQHSGVIYHI